ncbi:TPA: hypothetical protein ACGO1T_001803 [Streptococcus suis]
MFRRRKNKSQNASLSQQDLDDLDRLLNVAQEDQESSWTNGDESITHLSEDELDPSLYNDDWYYQEDISDGIGSSVENDQDDLATAIEEEHNRSRNQDPIGHRAKYSAKMDKFLNSGIIIVGVLLLAVLLIAFLV